MTLGYTFSAVFAMIQVLLTEIRCKEDDLKDLVDVNFVKVMQCIVVYCVFDALWGAFYSGFFVSHELFSLVCYGVYFMAGVTTLAWFIYITDYFRCNVNERYIFRSIGIILLALQTMLLISNHFTHEVFYINTESVVFTGAGRVFLQLLQSINYFLLVFFGIGKAVLAGKGIRNRYFRGIVYAVIPALFGAGQIFLFDVAMYSFGFAMTAYAMFTFDKSSYILSHIEKTHRKESEEQLSIINGLAGDFSTVYSVDMESGGFVVFNRTGDGKNLLKTDNSKLDYFRVAVEKGRRMIDADDLEKFLLLMDRDIISRRFEYADSFSIVLRVRFGSNVKYIEYRFSHRTIDDRERVIVGVYDIDKIYRKKLKDEETLKTARQKQAALEEEAQLLEKAAYRDIMTGLFNRRAYEDHTQEIGGMPDGDDFVYVSLDVNGLKAINDDLGHDAGDELIKGAAFCMKKILGEYGRIYRHGGDEFSAILHAAQSDLPAIFERFDRELDSYRGRFIDEVSVSYGYVTAAESNNVSIEEMAKIADERMYEAKNLHYSKKGIDRRGQQEAYDAIRKSYLKILKVDLKKDSFASVYFDDSEATPEKGYNNSLSKWVKGFADAGNVHPDDVETFLKNTDINRIKAHFAQTMERTAFHYRRKDGDGYSYSMLELIPSDDYSEDAPIVFLYVKNIY